MESNNTVTYDSNGFVSSESFVYKVTDLNNDFSAATPTKMLFSMTAQLT